MAHHRARLLPSDCRSQLLYVRAVDPPVMRTSTPCRTNSTVACDTAELLTGRCRMSVPATVVTGATILHRQHRRPVFESSRSARPGPLSVGFIARLTGRPSSFASRTIKPSGIAMRTQPFLMTSTVKPCFAGGEIAVDFQIVVDATECRFDRRRSRFGLGRRSGAFQSHVFTDGEDDPTVRARKFQFGQNWKRRQRRAG